jgi:hypothetical protein
MISTPSRITKQSASRLRHVVLPFVGRGSKGSAEARHRKCLCFVALIIGDGLEPGRTRGSRSSHDKNVPAFGRCRRRVCVFDSFGRALVSGAGHGFPPATLREETSTRRGLPVKDAGLHQVRNGPPLGARQTANRLRACACTRLAWPLSPKDEGQQSRMLAALRHRPAGMMTRMMPTETNASTIEPT